jgi:hypothetical protein
MRKIFLILPLLAAACGNPHSAVCEHAQACGRGSDREREACIADLDEREQVADVYGCGDIYSTYIECIDEFGVCDNDGNLGGCDGQHDAYHDCVERGEVGKAHVRLVAED